jgi:hypothetical protein
METNYATLRGTIAQCRTYIQNGFPEEHKDEIRAIRRAAEYRLDKAKQEAREARWN